MQWFPDSCGIPKRKEITYSTEVANRGTTTIDLLPSPLLFAIGEPKKGMSDHFQRCPAILRGFDCDFNSPRDLATVTLIEFAHTGSPLTPFTGLEAICSYNRRKIRELYTGLQKQQSVVPSLAIVASRKLRELQPPFGFRVGAAVMNASIKESEGGCLPLLEKVV